MLTFRKKGKKTPIVLPASRAATNLSKSFGGGELSKFFNSEHTCKYLAYAKLFNLTLTLKINQNDEKDNLRLK